MELLFKRSQTTGTTGRVAFKLWGKIEFDEEETALTQRYHFDKAILIEVVQPWLIRRAAIRGVWAIVTLWLVLYFIFSWHSSALLLSILGGGGFAYWYYHQHRETIFVRDLMHGRNFSCDSVVDLARKEAWLETICAYLRQVMESAKHWDGEVRSPIEALPKDEARQVILKGL